MSLVTHRGGCHCGRVRFEVQAPTRLQVTDCNCSVCSKVGYLHLLVSANRFVLLTSRDELSTYMFNTNVAKHYFCAHCGVKSFYIPRSHPDGISVNVRCIDSGTIEGMDVTPLDGRNWESARSTLSELTS